MYAATHESLAGSISLRFSSACSRAAAARCSSTESFFDADDVSRCLSANDGGDSVDSLVLLSECGVFGGSSCSCFTDC